MNEGAIVTAVATNGGALRRVPTGLRPLVWPIWLQQSSGVFSPAHWWFVFAQQAIAVAEDRNSAKALAATELASSTTIAPRNVRARLRTSRLCAFAAQ
jgi:hypothetical protein